MPLARLLALFLIANVLAPAPPAVAEEAPEGPATYLLGGLTAQAVLAHRLIEDLADQYHRHYDPPPENDVPDADDHLLPPVHLSDLRRWTRPVLDEARMVLTALSHRGPTDPRLQDTLNALEEVEDNLAWDEDATVAALDRLAAGLGALAGSLHNSASQQALHPAPDGN